MAKPTLKEAYETAFAVFSPAVQLVEWKLYKVTDKPDSGWLWGSWREIPGRRWIYVFRRPKGAKTSSAQLADEFFLDGDKQLHATPMDTLRTEMEATGGKWPERGKRGTQIKIGTTVSFIRQFLGKPFEYFFFSARVQLPSKLIDELQKKLPNWTQAVTFEPDDRNVIWGKEGENPRIPVLDPITIAIHLHAYYIAASDDLLKYLSPIDDPGDPCSSQAAERQKKFTLAQIIDSVVDQDRTLVDIDDETTLYRFLSDYQQQVQFREKWRNRWALFLSSWLRARPILLLAEAHQFDEVAEFPWFLFFMALVCHRLSESPEGRKLLDEHFEEPSVYPWIQKYVLGDGITPDEIQAVRKFGSAPLELLKEHAPAWMKFQQQAISDTTALRLALIKLFGIEAKPVKIVRGWYGFITASPGVREPKFVKHIEVELIKAEVRVTPAPELKPMWKGAIGSMLEAMELINFAIAVNTFRQAGKEGEAKEQLFAFIYMTGAGLDLSSATLQIFGKASKKTLAKLSFASAAIDTLMGAKETGEALREGRVGKAVGSAIVTIGSYIVAVGALFESSLLGPLGMAIVGVGYVIKQFFRDRSDLENFVGFSSFGKVSGRRHSDGQKRPSWYKGAEKFEDWGEHYDEQLRAAVGLLCRFKIEPAWSDAGDSNLLGGGTTQGFIDYQSEAMRRGTVKMGWIPSGAKLRFKYSEDWADPADSRELSAEVEFGRQESPKVESRGLSVEIKSDMILIVQAPRSAVSGTPVLVTDEWERYEGPNKALKKITLTGSLEVEMAGGTFSAGPGEDDGQLYTPWAHWRDSFEAEQQQKQRTQKAP